MAHIRELIKGKRLADVDLSAKSHLIVDNTLNDKAFALVRSQTLKVYTALAEYDKALLKMQEIPIPANTFEKNAKRAALEVALKAEMDGINFHYAGNTDLMLASGFTMNQAHRQPIDINQPAVNLVVGGAQPGRVEWRCDSVINAQIAIRYRIVGSNNPYQTKFSTKSSGFIRDLESHQKYEFEAVSISRSMQTNRQDYNWSQEKVWIVQ